MKICYNTSCSAGVAHPVERHLAKVEVASSSLVTRSIKKQTPIGVCFFMDCDEGSNNQIRLSGRQSAASANTG